MRILVYYICVKILGISFAMINIVCIFAEI